MGRKVFNCTKKADNTGCTAVIVIHIVCYSRESVYINRYNGSQNSTWSSLLGDLIIRILQKTVSRPNVVFSFVKVFVLEGQDL